MKNAWKAFAAVIAAAVTAGTVLSVGAAEAEAEAEAGSCAEAISPGIHVLAARCTVQKNAAAGEEMTFSAEDFSRVLGYVPTEITLQSLPDPAVGVLKLGTLPLAAGVSLSSTVLEGVRFTPADDIPAQTAFSFTARGGAYESAVPLTCQLYLLSAENAAPTAAAASAVTYEGTPVAFLPVTADAEADAVRCVLVRPPRRGTVTYADGTFVYTPDAGARGRDSFSWCAVDCWGGRSETVTTSVSIRRADANLRYADLTGHPCAAQAMYLTEEGIFRGTTVGTHALFSPDSEMSRGEFLVCAMRAAGYDGLASADAVRLAAYENADALPDWLTGYLAAAYEDGILRGSGDGAIRFAWEEAIPHAEAAVLLYRLFDIGQPEILPVFSAEEMSVLPEWSVGAVAAVTAAGIMLGDADCSVTRADAAMMLAGAMAVPRMD